MKRGQKRVVKAIDIGIEEALLLLIIILNIFDAFEFISPAWDYIKKIISWSALGVILYRAKISKIFTGVANSFNDLLLLFGYFFLIIKDLVSYAASALPETSSFLEPFFSSLVNNASQIELVGLYLGIVCLVFASIRLAFSKSTEHHSVMKLLSPKLNALKNINFKSYAKRFGLMFFIVMVFFVVVFSLVMSWLAIAIDAPLLMIGLFLYLFFVVKHKGAFSPASFLAKFGNYGEKVYTNFIRQLKYRRSALRVVSAMLVLHLVTDAFTYMMPMILGFGDRLYLGLLSTPHSWFVNLISSQFIGGIGQALLLTGIYLFSILGMLFLLGAPIVLLVGLKKKKAFRLSRWFLGLIVTSLTVLLGSQVIRVISLRNSPIYGVDIFAQTLRISQSTATYVLLGGILLGLIVYIISSFKKIRHSLDIILLLLVQLWFIIYVALFFLSIYKYYVLVLPLLFTNSLIVAALFFIVLFIITAAFYLFGTLFFVEDTHRHSRQLIAENR